MAATRDGVPIDNRDGRVLKCQKVKSLSGVRNALETAATPERQAVLFQRLFEHSNELELNRLRERLVSKKAEFYAARREYRQRISKPVSKRTKRDRAAITELLCVKDDLKEDIKDLRSEVEWAQRMVGISWNYLVKRLVPEYKVVDWRGDVNKLPPQLLAMILPALAATIEERKADEASVLDISDREKATPADFVTIGNNGHG